MSRRSSDGVTVRTPVPGDETPLHDLITDHFAGDTDYTVDLGLDDPTTHVRVAERDGSPVGSMALSVHDDRTTLREELYLVDAVEPVAAVDRYGLLEMGYVRRDHTGEGIGARLLERLHAVGRREGVDAYVVDAWFHGGPDSPERLFDDHGYAVVHRHSIAGHADGVCSKCGPDCVCEAALVVRYDRDAGDR
ncbi:N-acetyltransferase [Halobacteriales archaeon SW_7_71_33]|nr:MAG: N-acetyltransferase [Halobacteriales archaeon SW_7_71_33]